MTCCAPGWSDPAMNPLTPELLQRAGRIRLACFDVDGTLTDGGLVYGPQGESKVFNVMDGFGIRLLEENGIRVAFITARRGETVLQRGRDLQLEHVFTGVRDKAECLRAVAASLGLETAAAA